MGDTTAIQYLHSVKMSFFCLTKLGYQNTIGEHLNNEHNTQKSIFESGKYRTPDERVYKEKAVCEQENISYNELSRQTTKHIRTSKDPKDIFRTPCISSHEIANWTKHSPEMYSGYAKVPIHPRKNSEMTRFVEEMSLTNREFALF